MDTDSDEAPPELFDSTKHDPLETSLAARLDDDLSLTKVPITIVTGWRTAQQHTLFHR